MAAKTWSQKRHNLIRPSLSVWNSSCAKSFVSVAHNKSLSPSISNNWRLPQRHQQNCALFSWKLISSHYTTACYSTGKLSIIYCQRRHLLSPSVAPFLAMTCERLCGSGHYLFTYLVSKYVNVDFYSSALPVCLCVCLSVRGHISGTAEPIRAKSCVQISCSPGSVLFRRRCATFDRNGRDAKR